MQQQQIPAGQLSRVYSYDALAPSSSSPRRCRPGPIASAVGVTATLLGAAAMVIVPTLFVLLIDEVRTLRRLTVAPAPA